MDVIEPIKFFFKVSQIFGVLPYALKKSNNYYFLKESRSLLRYTKTLYWFLALSESSSVISSNIWLEIGELSTKFVIWLSSVSLYINFLIIFRTIVKKGPILCFWINQFNNLYIMCTVKIDQGKLVRSNNFLLTFTTFYFFVLITTKVLTYDRLSIEILFRDLIFFTRLWVIHLFLKHFVIFANYVRYFYIIIRENVAERKTSQICRSWLKILRELRSKDLFVKDFVNVLHNFYMPILFMQLIWFFATILCDITATGKTGMPTLMQVSWMVYICLETILYVTVCHFTEKEASRAIWCLQNFLISLDDPDLIYEVDLLSLQVTHTRLKFEAFGFFHLNNELLYSMIGATTTYTVILLQFQSDYMAKFHKLFGKNGSFIMEELMKLKPHNYDPFSPNYNFSAEE